MRHVTARQDEEDLQGEADLQRIIDKKCKIALGRLFRERFLFVSDFCSKFPGQEKNSPIRVKK